MEKVYDGTPSFFRDGDFFERYLGNASYYAALQRSVLKCARLAGAGSVIELGCALGHTSRYLAEGLPGAAVTGLDFDGGVIRAAESMGRPGNLMFLCRDMRDAAADGTLAGQDMAIMLYSFHHIPDPAKNKERFLGDCFRTMDAGAFLCIAETFLPEDANTAEDIERWYALRSAEGRASTFWGSLSSLTAEGIRSAGDAAETSGSEETHAGRLVAERDGEYLVTASWLKEALVDAGFGVVAARPVNAVGEWTFLARKPAETPCGAERKNGGDLRWH